MNLNILINEFIDHCIHKKYCSVLDFYLIKIFSNTLYTPIYKLFMFLVNIGSRNGHICIPLDYLFVSRIFNDFILSFLTFFFNYYLTIVYCIDILLWSGILSKDYWYIHTPLILYKNCIYLWKYWSYENNIITFIKNNLLRQNILSDKQKIFLNNYLLISCLDKYQKLALYLSITNKLMLISGGPGTGKTTLIGELVILIYKLFHYDHHHNIRIITPTGRSASHLTNCLLKAYSKLDLIKESKLIMYLPKYVITIHKLLGFNYNKNIIKYNEFNKLNISWLIIDECSMVDYYIFNCLIKALPRDIKIILIGDSNQLSPIETGTVFHTLCTSTFLIKNYIKCLSFYNNKKYIWKIYNICLYQSNVFFLHINYRFSHNYIVNKLIICIKKKWYTYIDRFLYNINYTKNFTFYDLSVYKYDLFFKFCLKKIIKYIHLIDFYISTNNYIDIFMLFNSLQFLTVVKDTYYGSIFLNNLIDRYLIDNQLVKYIQYSSLWKQYYFLGKTIILTKNYNELQLYNGNLGIFIRRHHLLQLGFIKSLNKIKYIYFYLINNWDNAWFMTVHKAQGLECDHIILLLPNYYSILLNNELIYTAITRAKYKVTVYGYKDIFLWGLKNYKFTFNLLEERLFK